MHRLHINFLNLLLSFGFPHHYDIVMHRMACIAGDNEDEYNFLKKICDIIVSLGSCQLADIWVWLIFKFRFKMRANVDWTNKALT